MSPTLELTDDLLRRPSVSPEDHGCLDVIGARLAPLGFRNERLHYRPGGQPLGDGAATAVRCCASPATPTSCRPGRARNGTPTRSSP